MLFLHPWLLGGLAALAVPIVIHLARRSANRPLDWGAMRFLIDSVVQRKRRMEWEEILLMVARCWLLALVALAVARPMIPPDSPVPWAVVLPVVLTAVALFGASFVLSGKRWKWLVRLAGVVLLGVCVMLVWWEDRLNLKRFDASGRRDVALVIDASSSMEIRVGGVSLFERALAEARQLVQDAPRGTAFAVVLGGPAPQRLTAAPLTHRADVLGLLEGLKPVGGVFRAREALGAATLSLAEGTGSAKEMVVLTDRQRVGWKLDQPGQWGALEEAWKALPAKPKLMVRQLQGAEVFRNVGLGGYETSRQVIGKDRDVVLRLEVRNTGDEAVTPGGVTMEVEGREIGRKPVGLISPGQVVKVEFRHRFRELGPQRVEFRMEGGDDFPADDRMARVVVVKKTLPVLLVEGNPSGGFFDRGAGYLSLALAPSLERMAGQGGEAKHLIEPKVVAAARLTEEDVSGAEVIVLADVPRLPAAVAMRVANEVAAGAGLLVTLGPLADEGFYRQWQGASGRVLPMVPAGEKVEIEGVGLAAGTLTHESLGWVEKGADLYEARVTRWRALEGALEGTVVGAALPNGDPWLVTCAYGKGRCAVVASTMDARAGNLPAKRSFVPLAHEVVTWCAGTGVDLNPQAEWSPAVVLGPLASGLQGEYFFDDQGTNAAVVRLDAGIDFRWMNEAPVAGGPHDRFRVHWTGQLVAPVAGEYGFSVEVDDDFEIRFGKRGEWWSSGLGRKELGRRVFEAGEVVPVECRYREDRGEAYVRLLWTLPGKSPQVIPGAAFRPGKVAEPEVLAVLDPQGQARTAKIRSGKSGVELVVDGAAVPGMYRVRASDGLKEWFPEMGGRDLPMAVKMDEEESLMEGWTTEDREWLRSRVDLLFPGSVKDLSGVLEGKGYGREIARWLVMAALAFLLLETWLGRWVSKSRKMGEEVKIEFGAGGVA